MDQAADKDADGHVGRPAAGGGGGSDSKGSKKALDARIKEAQSSAATRKSAGGGKGGGAGAGGGKAGGKGAANPGRGVPRFPRPLAPPPVDKASSQALLGQRLRPDSFLGNWADSLGNAVVVFSVCAYEVKLMATLSQPPRHDIHLKITQLPDGNWLCGNATLDPTWSTEGQLHWLTVDGRISVWVRPHATVAGGEGAGGKESKSHALLNGHS